MDNQQDIVHQEAEIKCPIPKNKHALINPAKLKREFGVQVVIPPAEEVKNQVIRVIGDPDKIAEAVKHIHEITNDSKHFHLLF